MRFVPVKTADQQAALMLIGLRDRLIGNRIQPKRLQSASAADQHKRSKKLTAKSAETSCLQRHSA